jgi:diguanylate cyclase (GGDEF)-like protein
MVDLDRTAAELWAELEETYRSVTELTDELEAKKEELERLTRVDDLTGLYNRRYFMERLERETKRSARYGSDLGFLIVDIDHFKRVNDTYGHLVGDRVLREVAAVISELARVTDLAGRFGGEEFCVALAETDLRGTRAFGERVREAVAARWFWGVDVPRLRVTCSVGVTRFRPLEDSATELIRRADEALYEAKRGGRNRVCVAGETGATGPEALDSSGPAAVAVQGRR